MPRIMAQGKVIDCETGANLRQLLLQNGVDLYNGAAKAINCRGIGTCGTCSVQVEGQLSEPNWREKARLSLPPHATPSDRLTAIQENRRLACQVRVLGDVAITKYDGFWGQGRKVVWTPGSAE